MGADDCCGTVPGAGADDCCGTVPGARGAVLESAVVELLNASESAAVAQLWAGLRCCPPSPPPPPQVCPPSPSPTRRGGERCHPRGPASSEVTRARQAHWELRSLECSRGREVLSTPQDLPSTGTLPAGLALCATLPLTLWVSQGAPQTTCPVHPSGVQSWAGGSCRSPNPQTPSAATW